MSGFEMDKRKLHQYFVNQNYILFHVFKYVKDYSVFICFVCKLFGIINTSFRLKIIKETRSEYLLIINNITVFNIAFAFFNIYALVYKEF